MTIAPPPLVRLRGIAKRFGSVQALHGADFDCAPGMVAALLGENGAGKSTLMHILYGLQQPDEGSIELNGTAVRVPSPRAAGALGIGMVHQHFTQVPVMTVAENVALGRAGLRFDRRRAEADVRRVSAATGLALDPAALAGDLPVGLRQRLEIIKALARDIRVLILDEPTASLAPREVDDLFVALDRLRAGGMAVILITHKLREVRALADTVTVLRRGRVVAAGAAAAFDEPALAGAMIGSDASTAERQELVEPSSVRGGRASAPAAVVVRDLSVETPGDAAVSGVTFEIASGEIVGIAAVEGNGQRTLMRALAGLVPPRGEVTIGGDTGFVPEDRQQEGLVLELAVDENLALGGRHGLLLERRFLEHEAVVASEEFGVSGDVTRPVATLSGGNQQKVVLARELRRKPALLIADNPTRGLDVGAAADVHARIRAAAHSAGTAVLFHSSDLDEVMALADRVAVMRDGRWVEVAPESCTRERVGQLMLGGT